MVVDDDEPDLAQHIGLARTGELQHVFADRPPTLERHLAAEPAGVVTGDEVDLAVTTDPNIIAALATCLNHRQGRNSEGARCHHFDNSKTLWPIPNSTRARWKR